MPLEDQKLAQSCAALAENTRAALQWLDDNRQLAGIEYKAAHTDLRRGTRTLAKCEVAAKRKMCVGVFGPSQSGKSYLISALARDARGELMADFAGTHHDFITEINPAGGKESTGLVTRFTTTRPDHLPAGYPIRLLLLSELDVVRVLLNTYYADCEHKEAPDQDSLLASLSQLEARKAASPVPGAPASDDVEELGEYIRANFGALPRPQMLDRAFCERAAELAPFLTLPDRAALFALIWNGTEAFTALYLKLCTALEQLGNPGEAHCPLEGLIPRTTSIIDVALLKNLSGDDTDTLTISGAGGRTALLPRSLVTALTAEITIYMPEKPDDFFDYTDLLDFPGYRSRLKLEDLNRELEREGTLENLFLRGKVAYLFERYCAERELTSMLLCIGPGNQEVQDLPRAVRQWIFSTHGEKPAQRALLQPSLFFVLSKMDMEFEKKKGTPSVEERWDTRLQSSLLDFFGKSDDWPGNWDGKPFNNVFLLRNPNLRCEAVFAFDGECEMGVRPEQQSYVHEVRDAFLHSALVHKHVRDPQKVWDAAMSLNDGGVGLLREALRPLCNPALKRQQIQGTVQSCLHSLRNSLDRFYKTDNKDELRAQKEQLAKQLAVLLAGLAESQLFGEFLRSLQVHDHDLHDLYFKAEQQRLQADTPQVAVVGTRVSKSAILDDIFGDDPVPAPAGEGPGQVGQAGQQANACQDEAERFTDLVLSHWMAQMHNLARSAAAQQRYNFSEKDMGLFVHELGTALYRLGLDKSMVAAQRQASSYGNLARERLVWKQVSLAADAVNALVDWLGFDPRTKDAQARTIVMRGKPVTLFNPAPPLSGPPEVGEEPAPYDRLWYTDWLRALVHTIEANVNFEDGESFDPAQNLRLKTILESYTLPALN